MRVVKNINNNVSLCIDSQGREVIAFGKGIGFTRPPYEVPLTMIQRTFYNVNQAYLGVIAQIPEEIIDVSTEIVDNANQQLGDRYSANVILTLADHIQFAIKRQHEQVHLKLPLLYEVKHLYPNEMKIGLAALALINSRLSIQLPEEEAASITLHLVDYGNKEINPSSIKEKSKLTKVTEFIETQMNIKIDKTGFNYSRFATHMYYLFERIDTDKNISSENEKMFELLKVQYPKTYDCAIAIKNILNVEFNDEELLYLIIHTNRLCSREDCYRQGLPSA